MWSRSCATVVIFVFFLWPEKLECTSVEKVVTRIVGGEEVSIEDFPYQVAIEGGNTFLCGGSIISPNWALTAAHCVYRVPVAWLRLRSGSSLYLKGGTIHKVTTVLWHSFYESNYKDYDVGLVLVSEPFQFSSYVQPIPLATRPALTGQEVIASGWGFLEQQQLHRPKRLMAVGLRVMDWNVCRQTYRFLTPRQMCAGALDKDTCYGDSGGPLVIGGKQVGIVSVGYRCAYQAQPGIYTNISVVGRWIEQVTQRKPEEEDLIVFPRDG